MHRNTKLDQNKLFDLLDLCPIGIAQCKIQFTQDNAPGDLIVDELNQHFAEILGLSNDAVPGKSLLEILPTLKSDDLWQTIGSMALASMNETKVIDYFEPIHNQWLKIEIKPTSPDTVALFLADVTPQKLSEEKLRKSEERFRLLVEMAPDIIFVQTEEKFAYVNQAMVNLLGMTSAEELLGQPVISVIHPDYQEIISKRIKLINEVKSPAVSKELVFIRKDGTPLEAESKAVPIKYESKDGALVFIRSITERKDAERMKEKLLDRERHRQKLEAIGMLAGGVAHEINNPIMGILNYAQLILDDDLTPSERGVYASEIIAESQRVANIVNNLLIFSQRGDENFSLAEIRDIVEWTLSILEDVFLQDGITIKVEIQDEIPPVRCRSDQIQQVLTNLLNNARDALNEKYPEFHKDKLIEVKCSLFSRNERPWIRLTVEDHGNGIPEEIRPNLFEPFFSTRDRLKNTGLGLPISYGIAEDHHGLLHFESETGLFTRFHLDLPVERN